MKTRHVVITSFGACTALGFSPEEIISRLKNGPPSFQRSVPDPQVVTCPIQDFDFRTWLRSIGRSCKERRYLNRGAQFCMAAALRAADDAGSFSGQSPASCPAPSPRLSTDNDWAGAGVFMGTGPYLNIGEVFPDIENGALDHSDLMALWMLRFLPNTAASIIAKSLGLHGENLTVNNACAASLTAIGEAYRKIRDGYLDLALAGGGDSRINGGGILAYKKAQALYHETGNEPAISDRNASRPFDAGRNGFVPGEGGAVFLLEESHHARKRGATIWAEISGFGNSMDGYNMTAPDPSGRWAEKAVRRALDEAGLAPNEIGVISAHGTGTRLNDSMEADLISRIFGNSRPKVIALKSWIGHLAAGCGAAELAIALTCMRAGYLPEIRNLETPCHSGIHFVRTPHRTEISTLLLQNFGFGGQNSALVVKRYHG